MFGGPGEIRTLDLFHAMEARSQLRHRPWRNDVRHENTTRAVPGRAIVDIAKVPGVFAWGSIDTLLKQGHNRTG